MKAKRLSSPVNPGAPLAQEHEFEVSRGLPEALPPGEEVLWQGSPDWRRMARHAFHVRKLVVYFAALVLLRVVLLIGEGAGVGTIAVATLWMVLLSATAIGLLSFTAWLAAKSAVYTLTNRRMVMRVGIVLTLTFNIPLRRIAAADLHLNDDGTGELPLKLLASDRIAYLHLWPHSRPWRFAHPEPMMRCIPHAAQVAQLLAQTWSQATGVELQAQPAMAAGAQGERETHGQPSLAGR